MVKPADKMALLEKLIGPDKAKTLLEKIQSSEETAKELGLTAKEVASYKDDEGGEGEMIDISDLTDDEIVAGVESGELDADEVEAALDAEAELMAEDPYDGEPIAEMEGYDPDDEDGDVVDVTEAFEEGVEPIVDYVGALEKEIRDQGEVIEEMAAALKEIGLKMEDFIGDQPRGGSFKAYRPSTDESTITKKQYERPTEDPTATITELLFGK